MSNVNVNVNAAAPRSPLPATLLLSRAAQKTFSQPTNNMLSLPYPNPVLLPRLLRLSPRLAEDQHTRKYMHNVYVFCAVRLAVCPSVGSSVHLSVCLSVSPSMCPTACHKYNVISTLHEHGHASDVGGRMQGAHIRIQ